MVVGTGFVTGGYFPVHAFLATSFALILLKVLQGRHVLVTGPENGDLTSHTFRLHQSDVNTLLSLSLVLIRTLAGCWLTLTGWRMTFITFELTGATLKEANRMIDYRIPPLKTTARNMYKPGSSSFLAATLWMIFLLTLPTQFVAPLLTGALNWIPGTDFALSDSGVEVTTAGPASDQWGYHNEYQNNRFYEVLSASGLSSVASPISFNVSAGAAYRALGRRFIPSILGTPLNSTLENVTVPYFEIHSLNWITAADQVKKDIGQLEAVISSIFAPGLNYSSELSDNPFSFGSANGRLVLVNDIPWTPAPYDDETGQWTYPSATVKTGVQWVIVALQWEQGCTSGWSPVFGPTPGLYMYSSPIIGNCYAFARMNYTAGATICKECRIVTEGVVEAAVATNESSTRAVIPDPLVDNAISMIPEVLFYMKISNSSQAPMWQNLDGFTRGMISVAYQASWNSLTNQWQASPLATRISTPYPVLIAQVTSWRVSVWLGLNGALTISGLVLAILQRNCQHKTVRNPALAALMLDTSALLDQDTAGLCNAVSLRKKDGSLRLRLKTSDNNARYRHIRLEADAGNDAQVPFPLPEYSSSHERLHKGSAAFADREVFPVWSENDRLWEEP